MFKNSNILITGGTGSFGNKFVEMTLKKFKPKTISVYSRDEMKQWEMALKYEKDKRVKFIIGDVRDKERLKSSLVDIDYVIHAAATKIIPTAEYNPLECIKTNIIGAMNIIDVCKELKIEKVVGLSTDKASNPINLYGATKLASDKLFVAGNSDHKLNSRFSVVRYGNVMGSRGSIIPFFLSLKNGKELPITDKRMTRFMITLEQAVETVWNAFDDMEGGEIYIRKIPSMNIVDIAKTISPKASHKIIGIRPGEKIHEQMIGLEDAPYTYEYKKYYKILPSIHNWSIDKKRVKNGIKVSEDFIYSSDNNSHWMPSKDLLIWIKENKSLIGKI